MEKRVIKRMIAICVMVSIAVGTMGICSGCVGRQNAIGAMTADVSAKTAAPEKNAAPEKTIAPEINGLRKIYKKTDATTVIGIEGYSKKELKTMFYIEKISDKVFSSMKGKSYPENCPVPRSSLRRVRILYYGFDRKTHIGELIVNKKRAEDFREIFQKLYFKKYQLKKVQPIDAYDGDDNASMEDNNTSCFNYRVVEGTTTISNHGYGVAVDINPRHNPYIFYRNGRKKILPKNGRKYADRNKKFAHKITRNDLCCRLFRKKGYFWGGDWNSVKDYQHFQKK